jgi:SAM-dependent methyltransferase
MNETDRIRELYAGDRYTVARAGDWSAPYHPRNPKGLARYQLHAIERAVIAVLNEGDVDLAGRTVLDLGCGGGHLLRLLVELGVDPRDCTGLDLMAERVELGKRCNPAMTFVEGDATDTGLDGPYDLVCQSVALCNLLDDADRARFAREMLRLTAPGGAILWHDIAIQEPGAHTRAVPPATVRELLRADPVAERWVIHKRTEQFVSYGMAWLADAIEAHAPRRLVPRTNYVALFRPRSRRFS